MGDSRKYAYCIPQEAFWNSEGKGGSLNWKSKSMGGTYDWNSEGMRGGGRGSREDRQECGSTNELAILLTTAESKIQDKH